MNKLKQLYIFTGKGGVGKTNASLAFCKYLQQQKQKCLYLTIDDELILSYVTELGIEHKNFELWSSVKTYLEKKFSSQVIASLILKTPFFRALVKMVPGFRYVIYMGHLLSEIENNPDTVYVLDSPSSGHLLTLFDSLYTFREIFGGGTLARDLDKSLTYWNEKKPYKVNIISLPHVTVLQESKELQDSLQESYQMDSSIFVNSSLLAVEGLSESADLPHYMKEKLNSEVLALDAFDRPISGTIPYYTAQEYKNLVPEISQLAEIFV